MLRTLALTPWLYFTDPVLRGPTLGSMLMCISAALVGVLVVLRRQSLLGESLSHAAYPGVMAGIFAAGLFSLSEYNEFALSFVVLSGGYFTSVCAFFFIRWLEKTVHIRSDAALCFTLSAFFGVGVLLASRLQFVFPTLYRRAQSYLYGQAATMGDGHIVLYLFLACVLAVTIGLLYRELQMITFDWNYAKSQGVPVKTIDVFLTLITVFAIVIGIRSVGVVLMSAMLIAPAAAARQFTNTLCWMFVWAALFGLMSAYLGNYLSFELSSYLAVAYPNERLSLPTGPMIILSASCICLLALLFAPQRGWVRRRLRAVRFRHRCLCENILKQVWRYGKGGAATFHQILRYQPMGFFQLRWTLWKLVRKGWVAVKNGEYALTESGFYRAEKIVRLHRLWEVYLVDYIGVGSERVHRNAEEMEHILTPEIEAALTQLLNNPKRDPHKQPIPTGERV